MKHVTIIGTSLNETSKSQVLGTLFEEHLKSEGVSVERIDLRKLNLPFAGSPGSWESKDRAYLEGAILRASHVVFAVPVYCYDVNSAAKNVIELVGKAFTKKVVGFICSAGGSNSYMAVMGLANHLMLDFRSVIAPRFVYVDSTGWEVDGNLRPDIEIRLYNLANDLAEIEVVKAGVE